VPNCKSFLVTEAERKHVKRRARFQQHGDASCHQIFFLARQGAEGNSRHSDRIITLGEHATLYAIVKNWVAQFNPLTPNDDYSGRTAPLTSKRCILYIYSTNIGTEYFKHGIYSPFFPLQNALCFINLTYLVPVLFTVYIENVLKFKKIIPAPKG